MTDHLLKVQAQAVEAGQFDVACNNFIPKFEFRKVLREFGFPIGALDFEDFLSR